MSTVTSSPAFSPEADRQPSSKSATSVIHFAHEAPPRSRHPRVRACNRGAAGRSGSRQLESGWIAQAGGAADAVFHAGRLHRVFAARAGERIVSNHVSARAAPLGGDG